MNPGRCRANHRSLHWNPVKFTAVTAFINHPDLLPKIFNLDNRAVAVQCQAVAQRVNQRRGAALQPAQP